MGDTPRPVVQLSTHPRPVGKVLNQLEKITLKAEAWRMTIERVPQAKICADLRISAHTLKKLVTEARAEFDVDTDTHWNNDLALLEELLDHAVRKYKMSHSTRDFEAVEKILARKAKMMGYDRDVLKAQVQHVIVDPKDIELMELINEANAKAAARKNAIIAEDKDV